MVNGSIDAIDQDRVESVSRSVRKLLAEYCPELIASAESFCEHVTYVPVSSVGVSPIKDDKSGMLGFRSADIKPRWVTVPMLYGLSITTKGLVAGFRKQAPQPPKTAPRSSAKPSGERAQA